MMGVAPRQKEEEEEEVLSVHYHWIVVSIPPHLIGITATI